MINLEKELESFIKETVPDGLLNDIKWKKSLKRFVPRSSVGDEIIEGVCDVLNYEFSAWKKRAELADQELESIKAEMAKYQSDDYVLVPKEPTEAMCNAGCDAHNYEIDCFEFSRIYQASIKAVENNHE